MLGIYVRKRGCACYHGGCKESNVCPAKSFASFLLSFTRAVRGLSLICLCWCRKILNEHPIPFFSFYLPQNTRRNTSHECPTVHNKDHLPTGPNKKIPAPSEHPSRWPLSPTFPHLLSMAEVSSSKTEAAPQLPSFSLSSHPILL